MSLDALLPAETTLASLIADYVRETRAKVNEIEDSIIVTSIPGIHSFTNADASPSVSGKVACVTANAGATTITFFDSGYNGQFIVVIAGDANTTIQHNTGLIQLTSQANVLMTTGEALCFVMQNNIWREIGGRRRFNSKEISAATYELLPTDRLILCNAGINQIDITFPAASTCFNDVEYMFKKTDVTANMVVVNGIQLTLQNEIARFVTDGTQWIQV